MKRLRVGLIAFVVGGLAWLPMGSSPARADDDWEDRWEDYHEELEERREDARERAEERWEDEQERLEELHEDGYIVRRHGRWGYGPRRYYQTPPMVRHRAFYSEPAYGPYYSAEPPVYEYYSSYPYQYRYYGVPGAGYAEGPYGQRAVRVGPVQVYWER